MQDKEPVQYVTGSLFLGRVEWAGNFLDGFSGILLFWIMSSKPMKLVAGGLTWKKE